MKTPEGPSAFDYLFVLRPVLLVPVWTIFLRGAAFTSPHVPAVTDLRLVTMFVALFALSGSAYVLNQYFDVETDRINRKLHHLPLGLITMPVALGYYVILTAVAVAAAAWLSAALLGITLAGVALGAFYSAPPWRLKDRPFAALLACATAHGPLIFLCGWLLEARPFLAGLVKSLPYFFAVGAVYILTTIPDAPGDREAAKQTVAVRLGAARAARWSIGWFWAGVLVAFYTVDPLFLLAALPTAPLFVRAGRGGADRARTAVRWSVVLLSLAACVHYPWYLGVLAIGWLGTRLYYRRRFDLKYP